MDNSFLDFFSDYKTVMLIVKPEDHKILNANKYACDYYGYSKEELLKMHVQDLNTLSQELIQYEMELAFKEKRNYFHFKHKLKNGEIRDIELHSSPIIYNNQKVLLSIVHDETSKIKEMLEIRSELESTLNAIPNLLFELSIDGVYLKVISNKPELLVSPKEQLIGKNISEFLPEVATQTCLSALQEADKTGQSMGKMIELQTPAGKKWFELSVSKKSSISDKEPTFVLLSTDITQRKEFEIQMIDAQDRFKALHDSAAGGIAIHDKGFILECNAKLSDMFGYSYEELINSNGLELISPKAIDTVVANIKNGYEEPYESIAITKNGREFPIRIESREIIYKGKNTRVTEFIDISFEKEANRRLSLAASVFSHAREGIMITDIDAKFVSVNDSFSLITGYSKDEVINKNPNILQSGIHKEEFFKQMWESIKNKGHWYGEIYNKRKNGEIYPGMLTISAVKSELGNTDHYIGIFSDISLIKENEQRLEHMAHYDPLTKLPNRVLFLDRLEQAIFQAKRRGTKIAILYVDLDYFKNVNDRFGHDVGDKLLVKLASNMQKVLRAEDTIARFGGDEFVGLLVDLQDTYGCMKVVDKLLRTLSSKTTINSHKIQVSASIGIALYPEDNVDPEILIRHADRAMYEAKQGGKNRYKVFNVDQESAIQSGIEHIKSIDRALIQNEFELYYQPKIDMKNGDLIGVEALIRWNHPDKGLLQPMDFLPQIENHEISIRLGEWVIYNALKQIESWQKEGLFINVSVNVNAKLFLSNFTKKVSYILNLFPNIDPHFLEIELLETSLLEDISRVNEIINECNELGLSFSIDDFGTGYSSLTYLKSLPVKKIKIDKSFVMGMIENTNDYEIVKGIMALAKAFRLDIIAEGVETTKHANMLLDLDCRYAQGYCIAKPMPAHKINGWLKSWQTNKKWLDS